MKIFTYGHYIKYIHNVKLNGILGLNEESNTYLLEKSTEETLLGGMLRNKENVANLINKFLKPKFKINASSLIDYTNNYNIEQTEVIYRLRNQKMFFLIKFRIKVDDFTSYEILKSCIDIIQRYGKHKQDIIIVPTIIYITKNETDNHKMSLKRTKNLLSLEYNLINFMELQLTEKGKNKFV